jgi:hypothetical protein
MTSKSLAWIHSCAVGNDCGVETALKSEMKGIAAGITRLKPSRWRMRTEVI